MSQNRRARAAVNDKTAYVSLLWGEKKHYMVEALITGCSLMHWCNKMRILFVDQVTMDSGFAPLLRLFWDLRRFEHMDVGRHNRCTQERLQKCLEQEAPMETSGEGNRRCSHARYRHLGPR